MKDDEMALGGTVYSGKLYIKPALQEELFLEILNTVYAHEWFSGVLSDDGSSIEWDEDTYCSAKWLEFLVYHLLEPKGYVCNGYVYAKGDIENDNWEVKVSDNKVFVNGQIREIEPICEPTFEDNLMFY